jgi:hypothetical protein
MAINRLARQFNPSDDGSPEAQVPKGFEAVPIKGLSGWTELTNEQRALYEFAFLLAQAQIQNRAEPEDGNVLDEEA